MSGDGETGDIEAAYQAVVAHIDSFETGEERHAYVTAAIAMHMYYSDGTLPASLGVRHSVELDQP
jgi:hypothetical protein